MQIDLSKPLAAAKFGELVGVSRQAVGAMVREGILSRGDSAGEWLTAYLGHLREIAAGRADTPAAQHSRERILAAEASRREEQAKLARIKRRQHEGHLIRIDDCSAGMAAAMTAAKEGVWSWQGTLPPLLVGLSMPQIAVVLEDRAREALENMALHGGNHVHRLVQWMAKNVPPDFWRDGGPMQPGSIGDE